ncbi:MAG: hypothetical protein KDE54_36985, partial [Caldilineaceae bacterium]|nr:hypothetical protein [Caldilineaceae bacterium]
RALLLARQLGDRNLEAWILDGIGRSYRDLGDASRSLQNYQAALTIARGLNDPKLIGVVLADMGEEYRINAEFNLALDR